MIKRPSQGEVFVRKVTEGVNWTSLYLQRIASCIKCRRCEFETTGRKRQKLLAKRDEPFVPVEHFGMFAEIEFVPVELGVEKCSLIGRIRYFFRPPSECCKFTATALCNGPG